LHAFYRNEKSFTFSQRSLSEAYPESVESNLHAVDSTLTF
jgi:hypothetical protein